MPDSNNAIESTFFSVASVESGASVSTHSDGDLWPSTWADNGLLYTACGDGLGFSTAPWSDIVVNSVSGTPETELVGQRIASGRDVAPIWGDSARYNSKPTGIIAVDGNGDGQDELYLAVQDLGHGPGNDSFNEAPTAGIVRSTDYGRSWTSVGPMFTSHQFTTIMFLDFGQSNNQAKVLSSVASDDGVNFVYAYGLDHNWRSSYSRVVPDPEDLYLTRVPIASIQDRDTWQFFAGYDNHGRPNWFADISQKVPVLHDNTRRYVGFERSEDGGTAIAQGGVVYNAPLRRYIYTSWTEFTFEFYEAPEPWGPWRRFLSRDFGPFPWQGPKSHLRNHGGYATTIPSKFISDDGRQCWVQSNWFWQAGTLTGRSYHFSLRKMQLAPASLEPGTQHLGQNLALPDSGASPFANACRNGQLNVLNDGQVEQSEDTWLGRSKDVDYWGYAWPNPVSVSTIVFTHGPWDYNGGFFLEQPRVEIRRDGEWCSITSSISPDYPADATATKTRTFTLSFERLKTDGVRIVGKPSGFEPYTSMAEIEVYDQANSN